MDATLANEKAKPEHVEHSADEIFEKDTNDKVDEFGAHTKTDPAEIKLVRKLDLYILVSLL
jgi:hypothetical protein